ncbi:MarR family transcriptional regulator [Brevibacillus laterosporus]|uniref:MarR family transcriptional regulator n=1 Tax=Brevibacillus laterosporus TaxID=1465 RepID=UPI0003817A6B|nr:MarR family transcriptional regulator [Brevibacillus laterosporus]ATO48284.1 transcriptional regulator [Brevibacillus laterosporus DSM 25]MBG9772704.1 transcriptional regulator [Brevibacillus laterosporus]MBG9798222.1 transcriptional regulator [Brevibacillus laterosporus]MCR8936810.1 MarR family transcriptional regulator [Brevibacillus laterosporus]MCZ0839449.1 MarR family transcriptional regulator [Brevibacillus laterosporus]
MEELITMAKLLKEASALFTWITGEELESKDITWQQVLILEQIVHGPKTIGEISKAVSLSYSTVSGLIDRLQRDNIVIRLKDKKDKRLVWVAMSQRFDHADDFAEHQAEMETFEQKTTQMISSLHVLQEMYTTKKRISS